MKCTVEVKATAFITWVFLSLNGSYVTNLHYYLSLHCFPIILYFLVCILVFLAEKKCEKWYWLVNYLQTKTKRILLENAVAKHKLAHPLSQDTASPTHCSCINNETELRVNRQLKSRSGCVWRECSAASRRLQSVNVCGKAVLRAHTIVRVCVYCVCQEIHTYTATCTFACN